MREGLRISLFFIVLFTYLSGAPLKVVTTEKWEPFNMVVKGRLEGIGIDFWKLVAKDLNLSYEFVKEDKWYKVLDDIKNKKAVLTISTDKTKQREKYAVFSKPYLRFPLVIATKNNIGFIFDVRYLNDKTIAIGKNYTAAELMKSKYPGLNYIYVSSTDEALSKVAKGEVFAAIDILPVIAYKINKNEFKDLKISGQVPLYFNVRFMINKDYSYLLDGINKAIEKIPLQTKQHIYSKYINILRSNRMVFSSNELLFFFLMLVSILNIFLLWIYMLVKEVKDLKVNSYKNMNKDCDRLTGALKKDKALELMYQKINNNENFSVIVLDIKDFKNINRFYGHHFGDITLLELTSLIKSVIAPNEVLVRIKGGSFAVITDKIEIEACERAKKLFKKIEEFEFSFVKRLKCTFVVKTFYGGSEKEEIKNFLDYGIQKVKKLNLEFKC